ncbi:FGGY family carbohydrate kinase [Paenibacillus sp. J2TS4]|uniref:FGGY family carbohydrate kinase n=1 Tax=Paenibacillus sp. J2TS4 TaxID=2807194 RepID=UPI001B135B4D|nr:FGGY family carbohydrate kinase [Paenibacillus sp. J2TS4]GIP31040.1 hypothetical protein J2TS4_02500 [Paenibacillus sp. J2TS4]
MNRNSGVDSAKSLSAMDVVASIDIGTTAVKGVLVGRDGELRHEQTIPLTTLHQDGYMEQDAESWWTAVIRMCKEWEELGVGGPHIRCVAFSGQMQDLIAVGSDGRPLRPAILYSDSRAGAQAEALLARITEPEMKRRTGNHFDGTGLLPGQQPAVMNVIGGGGKSESWMHILADITSSRVLVPDHAQFLPALGVASLGFVHLGWSADFADFKAAYLQQEEQTAYPANSEIANHYESKFAKYKKLYDAVQPLI